MEQVQLNTQPEALRLAELLAARPHDVLDFLPVKAAAELSRQYGEIKSMQAERLQTERRLRTAEAQRDQLLEALKMAVRQNEHDMVMTGEECRQCRAAIKAVEGDME